MALKKSWPHRGGAKLNLQNNPLLLPHIGSFADLRAVQFLKGQFS